VCLQTLSRVFGRIVSAVLTLPCTSRDSAAPCYAPTCRINRSANSPRMVWLTVVIDLTPPQRST
jgi:hypothetical protein